MDSSLRCFKSLRHSCLSICSGFFEFNDEDEVSIVPNCKSEGEIAEDADAEGALTASILGVDEKRMKKRRKVNGMGGILPLIMLVDGGSLVDEKSPIVVKESIMHYMSNGVR